MYVVCGKAAGMILCQGPNRRKASLYQVFFEKIDVITDLIEAAASPSTRPGRGCVAGGRPRRPSAV